MENIENFKISNIENIDLLAMFNTTDNYFKKKKYFHSLFHPILYYCINFLNNNFQKLNDLKNMIEIKHDYIYVTLNSNFYDYFFLKEKKCINKVEIDFKNDKENFQIIKEKKAQQIFDDLKSNEFSFDFDNKLNNYLLYQKEIISSFRYGYSIQESVIKQIIKENKKNIVELPNLIFYKNSYPKNILFREVDRIFKINNDFSTSNFKIYLKVSFLKNKCFDKKNILIFSDGEELNFKKDNLYFIEIKNKINSLNRELERIKKNNDHRSENSPSSLNSFEQKNTTSIMQFYQNSMNFLSLYKELNIKYDKVFLLFIFNSYFNHQIHHYIYDSLLNDFKDFNDFSINLELLFIHIDSDFQIIDNIINERNYENSIITLKLGSEKQKEINEKLEGAITEQKEINKNLEGAITEQKEINKNLEGAITEQKEINKNLEEENIKQKETIKKLEGAINDQKKEVEFLKLKIDKIIKENNEEKTIFNETIYYSTQKNLEKNDKFINLIKKVLKKYEQFSNSNIGIISFINIEEMGKYQKFSNINSLNLNFDLIIDISSFCHNPFLKIQLNDNYKNLFEKVKQKSNSIILLIDYNFLFNIKEILVNDYKVISIYPIDKQFLLIELFMKKSEILKEDKIIFVKNSNLKLSFFLKDFSLKIKQIPDFISYYQEILNLKEKLLNNNNQEEIKNLFLYENNFSQIISYQISFPLNILNLNEIKAVVLTKGEQLYGFLGYNFDVKNSSFLNKYIIIRESDYLEKSLSKEDLTKIINFFIEKEIDMKYFIQKNNQILYKNNIIIVCYKKFNNQLFRQLFFYPNVHTALFEVEIIKMVGDYNSQKALPTIQLSSSRIKYYTNFQQFCTFKLKIIMTVLLSIIKQSNLKILLL